MSGALEWLGRRMGRMKRSERNYSDEQRSRILREARRSAAKPLCPACGTPLEAKAVPPRDEVSYVRRRRWYVCGSCGRSAVFEEREISGPR